MICYMLTSYVSYLLLWILSGLFLIFSHNVRISEDINNIQNITNKINIANIQSWN